MEASMKLWEIGDEIAGIGALIAENGGELTPDLEAKLDALEGAFEDKAERIGLLIREREVSADAAKAEADRVAAIAKSHANTAMRLKEYLHAQMLRTGTKSVDTPVIRIRVQRNTQPTCAYVGDMDELPAQFQRIKIEVDKRAALEAWEQTNGDPNKRTAPDGFAIAWGTHVRIA